MSDIGSAHGRGSNPSTIVVAEARLVVNAAHTVVVFYGTAFGVDSDPRYKFVRRTSNLHQKSRFGCSSTR
jgi:hypothetical protein